MSEEPSDQPVDLVIDDKYKADGTEVGSTPSIEIRNLDRVVRMKLELRGTKLYGFVNYNQSHNKNERAKNKQKIKPPKFKEVNEKKPFTFNVVSDSDQVFEIESATKGNSIFIELVESKSAGGSTPAPSAKFTSQVAIYQAKSEGGGGFTTFYWIIIGVTVFLILLALIIRLYRSSKKLKN